MLKREREMPSSWGSSQARALMVTTVEGGRARRSSVARSLLKPLEPLLEEAFPPLAHDLGKGIEPGCDVLVL
jgi:hypothetical protein